MRRLLSILVTLAVCVAAVLLAAASSDKPEGKSYRVVFDNAFGLVEGGDFQVGGVTAGKTTDLQVVKRQGEAPKAVVTVEVLEPGFGDFRKDATCDIKPQSLIGEYFVDCQPGNSAERLPEGGTVPVEQTTSTIPADLINNIMRRPYKERFRLIVTTLGTGLAGRPEDLGEALRRAHPGLRETSRVLNVLGDQNQVIKDFIADSDRVVEELEANKADVARWVREAGDTAEITATRRAELRDTFRKLPTFLDELRPTMTRLGELADEQTPLLADLQRAAPSLDEFFTRLGPFAEASRRTRSARPRRSARAPSGRGGRRSRSCAGWRPRPSRPSSRSASSSRRATIAVARSRTTRAP
jgi:virulence factor Mce-like protein